MDIEKYKSQLIDLGAEDKYPICSASKDSDSKEKEIVYPSLCIRDVPELLNDEELPEDEEVYALVKIEKTGYSKKPSWSDDKDKDVEVTLSVKSIAIIGPAEKDEEEETVKPKGMDKETIESDLKEFLSKK